MRIIHLFSIITLFFFLGPLQVSAEYDISGVTVPAPNKDSPYTTTTFNCPGGPLIDDDVNNAVDKFKDDEANLPEKFLTSQMQNLWNIGDLNGLSTLIYGNPYCLWADTAFVSEKSVEMSSDGIFTRAEREQIIDPILKMFRASYIFILVAAILISSLKTMINSTRGRAMAELGEDMKMWVWSGVFIAAYPIITDIIFQLNAAIVLQFKALLESSGTNVNSFSLIASWKDLYVGDVVFMPMSYIIVVFAEWILALILNFVYVARKIIIIFLLALGFVAAYSLLFARTRSFFGTWLKELCSNVFLQSVHALVLFAIVKLATVGVSVTTNFASSLAGGSSLVLLTGSEVTSTGAGSIYKLILMTMFIPISGMITKWLQMGDTSSKLGTTLTMMGLGGATSTYMLMSQAGNIMKGGGMHSSSNMSIGGNPLSSAINSSLTNTGMYSASDSAATAISMSATGANSNVWNKVKDSVSKTAGVTSGIAGIVGGPAMAAAAYKLGSAGGGALVQIPRNMSFGVKNMVDTIKNAKQYSGPGGIGMKGVMSNLAARRNFFGNMGESIGSTIGQGVLGRQLGHIASGVSRQNLAVLPMSQGGMMFTDSKGTPMLGTFQNLAHHFPGQKVHFIQTNQGSGFYLNDNGKMLQIGLSGAADPSLDNGVSRVIDYNFNKPNSSISLGRDGQYSTNSAISLVSNSNVPKFQDAIKSVQQGNGINSIGKQLPNPTSQAVLGIKSFPLPNKGTTSSVPYATLRGIPSTIATSSGVKSQLPVMGVSNYPLPKSNTTSGNQTTVPYAAVNKMNFPAVTGVRSNLDVATNNTHLNAAIRNTNPNNVVPLPDLKSYNSIGASGNRHIGLPGSTDYVQRTSGAYLVNGLTTNGGQVTSNSINILSNSNTARYDNPSFRADHINPDNFVYHIAPGVDTRNNVDVGADLVRNTLQRKDPHTSQIQFGWAQLVRKEKSAERKSGII